MEIKDQMETSIKTVALLKALAFFSVHNLEKTISPITQNVFRKIVYQVFLCDMFPILNGNSTNVMLSSLPLSPETVQ